MWRVAGLYYCNKWGSTKIIDDDKEYLVRFKSAAVSSFPVTDKVGITCLFGFSS
jgi:hypothetical protein